MNTEERFKELKKGKKISLFDHHKVKFQVQLRDVHGIQYIRLARGKIVLDTVFMNDEVIINYLNQFNEKGEIIK